MPFAMFVPEPSNTFISPKLRYASTIEVMRTYRTGVQTPYRDTSKDEEKGKRKKSKNTTR